MQVLLTTTSDEMRGKVTKVLTDCGFEVVDWSPGSPAPAAPEFAVIDGLDAVVEAFDLPVDIVALVTEEEIRLFPECPREIADFVVKPIRSAELTERIMMRTKQPSLRERTHRQLLAIAVETAGDIIEITTADAVYEYVNPTFETVLGFAPGEALGKTPGQLIRSDAQDQAFFSDMESTLSRGETWKGTVVSKARDGRRVHLDATISALRNAKGQVTHHLGVKRDITDRLAREEALIEANRALLEARDVAVAASRAKSEFLANMSHELRTPLNAVIGYSELLLEDFVENEQVAKDLQRIRDAGAHLLTLINDVLDLSKIEAEKVELFLEELSLEDLARYVAATIEPLARKNENAFATDLTEAVGTVWSDRTRLRQVLLNLLSNACKFTKGGEVTFSVRTDDATVVFEVQDTGIGISPEQQAKLFRPFVQADASTSREYGGTGLGLVICKRIVEHMGGSIQMESVLGQGTTMRVTLPRNVPETYPSSSGSARLRSSEDVNLGGPNVLLIDDDPDVREIFIRVMEDRGFRPTVASSGQDGLELAARLKPDAIVLDVKMPGLSGWEVLSALKLSDATAEIPVIMLTFMQQREVGQVVGAVDYLMKPIEPDKLASTLRRHVGSASKEILVVEDDDPTRELICRTLEKEGHVVRQAVNGADALEKLERHEPSLIVLDLMMPVMDGFTFLEKLRSTPRWSKVPVVVATARELSWDERSGLEQMAERIIAKNAFDRRELMVAISEEINSVVQAESTT